MCANVRFLRTYIPVYVLACAFRDVGILSCIVFAPSVSLDIMKFYPEVGTGCLVLYLIHKFTSKDGITVIRMAAGILRQLVTSLRYIDFISFIYALLRTVLHSG